jgi:hypothetical protein
VSIEAVGGTAYEAEVVLSSAMVSHGVRRHLRCTHAGAAEAVKGSMLKKGPIESIPDRPWSESCRWLRSIGAALAGAEAAITVRQMNVDAVNFIVGVDNRYRGCGKKVIQLAKNSKKVAERRKVEKARWS